MLDRLNRINCLLDIYGDLLTSRQQEALQLHFSDDLTLSEIAARFEISRQAVYDLIKRAIAALERLEDKLKVYAQFKYLQQQLEKADRILGNPDLGAQKESCVRDIVQELLRYNKQ